MTSKTSPGADGGNVVPLRPLGVEVSSAAARRSAQKFNAAVSAAIRAALEAQR